MILIGKVKTGLGNANFWVKKIENIFYEKTGMKLFSGTLNIQLETEYELQDYWVIHGKEYGGTQEVYVQQCKILGNTAYIVRAEKTAHKSDIIEVVSNIKFRDVYNLKDEDIIKVEI